MCSILGWCGEVPQTDKVHALEQGNRRGRDGYGFDFAKGKDKLVNTGDRLDTVHKKLLLNEKDTVIGSFRATPTTEAQSKPEWMQPYNGIVHNGVIANDKTVGDYPIDSMILPDVLKKVTHLGGLYTELKDKIKGSYALAYFVPLINRATLMAAVNYKPFYYKLYDEGILFASIPEMFRTPDLAHRLRPYTLMKWHPNTGVDFLPMTLPQNNKVLVCCSGGLDSVTVAYMLRKKLYDVTLVYFLYDCLAQQRELDRIREISRDGDFALLEINMPLNIMTGSIVEGSYHREGEGGAEFAHDWVSARNLLMLSMLTAMAESQKYGYIAFGGNLEESGAYPDNEQEFGRLFNDLLPYAVQNNVKIELLQPVSTMMKHEIVKEGIKLGVPFDLTWSCYGEDDVHCGECGPCFMRKTAFKRNGLTDPVPYAMGR